MKNSVELKQERAGLIAEANTLLETCKTEVRNFTEDEQVSYDAKMTAIDSLKSNIDLVERQEKLNAEIASTPVSLSTQNISDTKELREYSFVDAAIASYSGNVSGLVKEMDQEARSQNPNQAFRGVGIPYSVLNGNKEHRADATLTTANTAATEVASFIDQLQANSVLVAAGSNFYSGLAADRKFPIVQNIASSWIAETGGTRPDAIGDFAEKTLSPKKVISIVDMSVEALVQNPGIEGALRKNLAASMMAKMAPALSAQADVTSAPTSIFLDANPYSVAAASIALVAGMEAELIANGVGLDARTGYIFNPAAWSAVAGAAGADFSAGYLDLREKMINNTPYFVTSALGSDGTASKNQILCGDFSKVHLAIFGGLDVLFDPYTQAGVGAGRMVATGLVDGMVAQGASVMQSLIEA